MGAIVIGAEIEKETVSTGTGLRPIPTGRDHTAAAINVVTTTAMTTATVLIAHGTEIETGRQKGDTLLNPERRRMLIAALVAAIVMALPGVAFANDGADTKTDEETTTEETPAPEPTEVLSTLPVLGSGLNITITRGDGGTIESVALDPDTATITKESDHRVVFLLEDGNTEVVVKSGKGYVKTTVKADDVADVAGDGAWAADIFGNGQVVVPYNVSFDGITPTITLGTMTLPEGVTADVGEAKVKTSEDANKAYAKVRVKFTSGDQTAVLSLKAKVFVNDEGQTKVKVSATLSSRDRGKCGDGHHDRSHRGDGEGRHHRGDGRDGDGRHGDHDGGGDSSGGGNG